ncbi:Gfo/Idh/MocA family oxidoreductase [Candidatus Woesebacteria bacterium]|nr:Gfo/Idh/MocA family oxidoreductase [Candidatus Woesebacteria bacterium]
MIKVALVGYGYWGPNLLRNFIETPNCDVVYCCDVDETKLDLAKKRYPFITTTTNYKDILNDKSIDAIIIATPVKYHYKLAKDAIISGKHVLIEKPMTIKYLEGKKLCALAKKHKKIIMVDHTFLYNEAVDKIKELISSPDFGKILYIDSTRANLGLFQTDINVLYDLAPHDFSIVNYLLNSGPTSVQSYGKSHFNSQEDVSYIFAEYPNGVFVHFHLSWLSPLKIRKMIIVGIKKMLVYDDTKPSEKIKVYDKGVSLEKEGTKKANEIKIGYRSGDVWLPDLKTSEPLAKMAGEFIKSISTNTQPISSGAFGVEIVKVLEKSTKSLRTGRKIYI